MMMTEKEAIAMVITGMDEIFAAVIEDFAKTATPEEVEWFRARLVEAGVRQLPLIKPMLEAAKAERQ
jgi:hypothetical protein